MAGRPLVVEAGEEVLAVFVFGRQVVEVGAVVGETLGNADVGLQQGGIEAPVDRLDVGVPPGAFVTAQTLTADAGQTLSACYSLPAPWGSSPRS